MIKVISQSTLTTARRRPSMTAKPRIRIELIDEVQGVLDALPQHQPNEVTKCQAIQRLLPQIRASRSKGYSLAAIGKVLTERGIPVTTGALRAHLSAAKAGPGGGKTKARRATRIAQGSRSTQAAAPVEAAQAVRTAPPRPAAAKPSAPSAPVSVDLTWDAAAPLGKPAPARSQRGTFVPAPDGDLEDL
jgi:hypothetical protein